MPANRSRTPEDVFDQRLAVRALDMALDSVGITGPVATVKWNPDDPAQVFPLPEGEVRFGAFVDRWDLPWAVVRFSPDRRRARVIVERVRRLIRTAHLRDFDERAHGIYPSQHQPDLDVEVDLTEVLDREGALLRTAPVRPPSPRRRHRVFGSRRSI